MARKYFGTDGIRGAVGKGAICPQFFLQLGWAVGKVLGDQSSRSPGLVLIGKDTRISGYMFESALEAGLISAGVDVGLLGPMPTPAIAYLTRTFQAKAGIVISASHNPYTDNGIKLFNTNGTKLADELELAIEDQLDQAMTMSTKLGKARRIDDAEGRYIEFCKASLPSGFSLSNFKIVLDCANGATYNIAPQVFQELGADVESIGVSPDGLNINRECGSTHLDALQQAVKDRQADLGIAFDGDGDRVMFVDGDGHVVDGDELLFIIAKHRHERGRLDGVVGTLMTNYGFELKLKELGIPFSRSKVGDRYVIEMMANNSWNLGGENSGHIVCSDYTTTGDGIISALQALRALCDQDLSLSEARKQMSLLPQVMINVPLAGKVDLAKSQAVQTAVQAAESSLDGSGRVLLRPSGTEPVVRVMVEGKELERVEGIAKELAEVVGRAVA
jgi:phosphoglucosamine mutase